MNRISWRTLAWGALGLSLLMLAFWGWRQSGMALLHMGMHFC